MRLRKFAVLSGLLAIFMVVSSGVAYAELLFKDDFSTGDFSRHNENFRWGRSGNVPKADGSSSLISKARQPNGEIGYVMEFEYGKWQEIRFHLTESLKEERTETGPSNVAYPELWISYQMKVPENYFHQLNENGYAATMNNKGWVTLWKHDYHDPILQVRFEWWPVPGLSEKNLGGSSVSAVHTGNGGGHDMSPSYVSAEARIEDSGKAWAINPNNRGEWVSYAFHYKVASGPAANDGLIEIYKNGSLAVAWYNISLWPTDGNPAHAGFDRGYIMGWHNADYHEKTVFHIDNFKIGTTAESVRLGESLSRAPKPPEVLSADR